MPLAFSSVSVREGTFLIGEGGEGGGGGAWASEGRVISKYLTNWGGLNLFYAQPGEGSIIFCKENNTPCRLDDSYLLTNMQSV